MDIIIDWESYETVFGDNKKTGEKGEKITMELRSLRSWAMFALQPYLGNPNPKLKEETPQEYANRLTDKEKSQLTHDSQKIQDLSAKIFPEHVRNLKTITVNGEPVTWEQIAQEAIFLNLAVEISGQLASITKLTRDEEKNSEGQSDLLILEEQKPA